MKELKPAQAWEDAKRKEVKEELLDKAWEDVLWILSRLRNHLEGPVPKGGALSYIMITDELCFLHRNLFARWLHLKKETKT